MIQGHISLDINVRTIFMCIPWVLSPPLIKLVPEPLSIHDWPSHPDAMFNIPTLYYWQNSLLISPWYNNLRHWTGGV